MKLTEVKKSLNLAIPLLLSEWLYALNFFVSTWITAQLGKDALAAISLAQSIYFFLMMMISGVSAATAILTAQSSASNNIESIKKIFAQSILLNMILALIAGVILWNVPRFIPLLGIKDAHVVELIKTALRAFMWSLFPLALLIMVEKFLIGLQRTRLVLLFTTLIIPVSIVANYAFVLGKFGLPKYGLAGFGYGNVAAYGLLVIIFVIMSFVMPSLSRYKLFSGFKNISEHFKYFWEIWRIGWPLGAMFSIEVGAIVTFTFLMSLFGTDVLAAFQVSRQYLVFALTTLFALTESSAVRVSYAVGEKDLSLVKQSYYVNIVIALVFMLLFSCVYLSAKNFLISFDMDITNPKNYEIVSYIKHFLTAISVLILFDGVRNISAGALRALKDTKSNMYSSILGYWLIGLPLGYLFGKIIGFHGEGLWMGFIAGVAISAAYLFIRFRKLCARVNFANLLLE